MKPAKNTNKVKNIIESLKESTYFQQAFTHSSYCNEEKLAISYEVLEFLGDSVLNFYTTLFIYRTFPHYSEGEMSKTKQLMVQESTLANLSREIGLNRTDENGKLEYLKLGVGEQKSGGANKDRILADVFESFLAALYLEKGGKKVVRFLELTLFKWIQGKIGLTWDYKTQLQEYCQAQKNRVIYRSRKITNSKRQQLFVAEVSDK